MNKLQLSVLSLFFIMLAAFPLSAKDFNSSIENAREAYQAENNLEAFQSLRESIFSLWDDIPLTVLNAKLVKDHNNYISKDSNVYSAGEPIYIVCQVVGYKIEKTNSLNHITIATDLHVLDPEGNILMGKKNFGSFDFVSPFPNTEFKMDLTYTLSGAPPGKYLLETVLRDKNSNKTTEFVKTIKIEK
ncbi:hypothetical protein [Flexistipes sp.]|uniref:hypothetical protein n=1 Tax=Flexistipes sp. TaxID=3088135 RepID=UPI002E225207|nr:hypothetical protein [Flexistipes sp.]